MRPTLALGMFRPTARMMKPPTEDQSAHTISQRLRKLKKIPPELYPLGAVVIFACGAAFYSIGRHFITDPQIRRWRKGSQGAEHHGKDEH